MRSTRIRFAGIRTRSLKRNPNDCGLREMILEWQEDRLEIRGIWCERCGYILICWIRRITDTKIKHFY